jgi:hexosaminidase
VWAANDARFQATAKGNSLLAELKPLAKDLSALGAMGAQILDNRVVPKPATDVWIATQAREIARMEKPTAEVLLAATRPVKLLLEELARRK